jgi:rhodanese-related sulfurtransferase
MTPVREGIPEIDPTSAAERLAGGAVALDVREQEEWDSGRIAGALHIPLGELGLRQAEIPRGSRIVCICRSGNRSAAVTEALVRAGYEAENLAGGMKAWKSAGLPIEPAGGWIA